MCVITGLMTPLLLYVVTLPYAQMVLVLFPVKISIIFSTYMMSINVCWVNKTILSSLTEVQHLKNGLYLYNHNAIVWKDNVHFT